MASVLLGAAFACGSLASMGPAAASPAIPLDELNAAEPGPSRGTDAPAEAPSAAPPGPSLLGGAIDSGWSGDGVSLFPSRYSIALGPTGDGGTFVGSYKVTDGNGPMRISKFTPAGTPAAGWGSSGYVLRAFEPGGLGVSFPVHVVPSGSKVTVVGEHYRSTARLGVARFGSTGAYDTTFSGDGRALYRVFPGEHDIVSAFRADVLTGGKIGIAAIAFDYDSNGVLQFTAQAMLRLNANGTLDTTFSLDGVAVIPNSWSDIRWQPNGTSFVGVQGATTHQVRRLRTNGQPDPTFSGDGIASAACGTHRGANLEVDPSGRAVLMCVKPGPSAMTLAMYRFTTTGGFDTTYSGDGKTSWVIPSSTGAADDLSMHFDDTAKPWVAAAGPGETTSLRIYTLDASGNPDAAFSPGGQATVVVPWTLDISGIWRSGPRLFVTSFVSPVEVGIIAITI